MLQQTFSETLTVAEFLIRVVLLMGAGYAFRLLQEPSSDEGKEEGSDER